MWKSVLAIFHSCVVFPKHLGPTLEATLEQLLIFLVSERQMLIT